MKRKLIEVALPLDAINRESAREKSIRHGHPSTLHLWWARRPLASARAVLFASLVDDPSSHPDRFPTEEAQEAERQRLFGILEELVKWENTTNEQVLEAARQEILASTDGNPPPILDPFSGGGTIPLEAQRLGLEAHGGDLNPVAVLIGKAMVEIPPRFANRRPVNPDDRDNDLQTWSGAQGLAAEVRYYGQWMRERALERIGGLYPKVNLPPEHGGGQGTVIAWIWARTVESPDPSWEGHVPLVRSWVLRKGERGKPAVWVEPQIEPSEGRIGFAIREGGTPGEPSVERAVGTCIATGAIIDKRYIKAEASAGRMSEVPIAVVVEGTRGRAYLAPSPDSPPPAPAPGWLPSGAVPERLTGGTCYGYGLTEWSKLFTDRQLTALNTFSELLVEVGAVIQSDARAAGMAEDGVHLRDGGSGATAYADAIRTYLGFAVDKCADYWSSISTWASSGFVRGTFARQAIPMTWDFAEINPFSESTGNWMANVDWVWKAIERMPAKHAGEIVQRDAEARVHEVPEVAIATDPPYYDNISYADLSDFFYVWMRRNLRDVWPDELSTLLTPKAEELVANPWRHGGKQAAYEHFEEGMSRFMARVSDEQRNGVPATIFYAFKAEESDDGGVTSTGWETFLQSVVDAGLEVTATWPMRTERPGRALAVGTAALASSIVLACRKRSDEAPMATRAEFESALEAELADRIALLQRENIAPVDLAQSAIGPGMAIFTRYRRVVEADGSDMKVRAALQLINAALERILSEEETLFDPETRWALTWYEQYGLNPGSYGDADTLSKAKDTSVAGVVSAGIAESSGGKVRLLAREELPIDWDPLEDPRLVVWEIAQNLVRKYETGELLAAAIIRKVGLGTAEKARQLAYLLYQLANRKGSAKDAAAYNRLVQAWPALLERVGELEATPVQGTLGE